MFILTGIISKMTIDEYVKYIFDHAATIIAVASAIAAALPPGKEGSFWNVLRRIIDVLSLSFGNAGKAIKQPES